MSKKEANQNSVSITSEGKITGTIIGADVNPSTSSSETSFTLKSNEVSISQLGAGSSIEVLGTSTTTRAASSKVQAENTTVKVSNATATTVHGDYRQQRRYWCQVFFL